MRAVLLLGLAFQVVVSSAQTVLLPTWVADSLIFEVQKGRQCSVVLEAQANELEKQGRELIETGTALRLSQNESKSLQGLVENAKEGQEILTQQFNQDRKALRKKVRIRNLIIGGQFILILIILL